METTSKLPCVQFDTSDGPEESEMVFLSKKKLLEVASTPFWVRLRATFFISFWIIWFTMLISSMVIIVKTPYCPIPSKSLTDGIQGNLTTLLTQTVNTTLDSLTTIQ